MADRRQPALEILRGEHPVEQRARQRLAGVDVRGHVRNYVPLPAEILHELAGKLDRVPFDALDARDAGDLDAGQQLMQAVAELVEERDDFVVRERRRPAFDRRRQIAGEERDRMLEMRADATAVDRVVHPGAALLAGARVDVEIELSDQRAGGIGDVEEAHVGMPGRARGSRGSRCRRASPPRGTVRPAPGLRESTDGLPVRRTRSVCAFSFSDAYAMSHGARSAMPSSSRAKRSELGVVALGEGRGAAREVAQEAEHLVDAAGHLRHQRELGEIARSRGAAPPRAAARGCAGSPQCCPIASMPPGPTRASRWRDAAWRAARDCRRSSSPADSTACAA